MTVTNVAKLDAYAQISLQTYDDTTSSLDVEGANGTYEQIGYELDGTAGFQARAFFNTAANELVIGFAGTEGLSDFDAADLLPDLATDFFLAISGATPQIALAEAFIDAAKIAATDQGFSNFSTTYTGHSLGGFLAQVASTDKDEGEVVVFNSPGVGGFLGLPEAGTFPESRYTYVYSEPAEWGVIGTPIHSVGRHLSTNIYVVPGAKGHRMTDPVNGTGLSDMLTSETVLIPADDSIFAPMEDALALLGLTSLYVSEDTGGGPTSGDDVLTGTDGTDTIDGGEGDDSISGKQGNDSLLGGDGEDSLYGNAGDDTLEGGTSDDYIDGGVGDDLIIGGGGADLLEGSGGTDTLSYEDVTYGTRGVTVNLATGYTGRGTQGDRAEGFEKLIGSPMTESSDYLNGDDGANNIKGLAGDDFLDGHGGSDSLFGDTGSDEIIGGGGSDRLVGGQGADTLIGGAGNDIFVFEDISDATVSSPDKIDAASGDEAFEGAGASGGDVLNFGAIDADVTSAGDQAFSFGSTGKGGLFLTNENGNTAIYLNVDDDTDYEFKLLIKDGATGAGAYGAGDFVL